MRLRGEASALAPALFGNLLQILTRDHRRHPEITSPAQTRHRQAVHALTARITAEPGRTWTVAAMARETGTTSASTNVRGPVMARFVRVCTPALMT